MASARLDAALLLRTAAGWSAAELIARGRDPLPPPARAAYERLLRERAARRPLQHLLGEVEFFGLTLAVGPGALIPRPDTETLVEAALARFARKGAFPLRLADVGCGTGAIALALASQLPNARLVAVDRAPGALELAAGNIRRCGLGSRVRLVAGDLLASLAPETLDGVVANPPYLPEGEIARLEPEVRDHEPRAALAGGPDGLDPLRRLAPMAARVLRRAGPLLVEIGAGQHEAAKTILRDAGFEAVTTRRDLAGIPRVVLGSRAERG